MEKVLRRCSLLMFRGWVLLPDCHHGRSPTWPQIPKAEVRGEGPQKIALHWWIDPCGNKNKTTTQHFELCLETNKKPNGCYQFNWQPFLLRFWRFHWITFQNLACVQNTLQQTGQVVTRAKDINCGKMMSFQEEMDTLTKADERCFRNRYCLSN